MVLKITKQNFENEVEKSDKLVLLDFSSQWCHSCKMLLPIIEEIAKDNNNIKVGNVSIDDEIDITVKFKIMSIPTLVLIKDNEVVDTIVGFKSKKAILNTINKHVSVK